MKHLPRRRSLPLAALAVAAALALSACGGSSSDGDDKDSGTQKTISVVASTDVWGDIASQVGGDSVDVTSIITDPDQDPHSYEASTKTALEIKKAQLIVENGGGYDDFVGRMRSSTGAKAPVVDAVKVSGKKAVDGELNEHVWYDFPTVDKVAAQIGDELAKIDPSQAAQFHANVLTFRGKVDALLAKEAAIKIKHGGEAIGITEPVPLYMTAACGLVNKTPAKFSEAVEEGSDVAPAVLQDTLDLYSTGQVKALVYNEQTSGAVTDKVLAAAKSHHVGVVPVTETLPDGDDTFIAMMSDNLNALSSALGDQ